MAKNVRTDNFAAPLNGATSARIEVDTRDGNLTIDRLGGDESLLASGTLQYLEKQGLPVRTLDAGDGQATLALRGGEAGQPWFRLPWATCNGATAWHIHLNPAVALDIAARSGGGNIRLDLAGLVVTHIAADTGGGNVEVALPAAAADLNVTARTGAGNVTVEIGRGITGSHTVTAGSGAGNVSVRIPSGIAAKVHATTGLGKAIINPRFAVIDSDTYQSSNYDGAADRVEITLKSGAGNVSVDVIGG